MADRTDNLEGQIADVRKRLDQLTAKTDPARKGGLIETLSALSPLISGVLIAAVGTFATILYNERQLQLTQLAALDKYRIYLTSENPQERAFGYEAFVALGQEDFVIKLISAKNDNAGKTVLTSLVDSSKDKRIQKAAKEQLEKLGALSAKYETTGNSAFVGIGPAMGLSYGKYSFSSKTGELGHFLRFLKREYPEFASILQAAGGENAAREATQEFQSTWKRLGTDSFFSKAQDDYVQATYYEIAADHLVPLGLDVRTRSRALQNVGQYRYSMDLQE